MRNACENARKMNRDDVADVSPDEAWNKIKQATAERDAEDAKEGIQEYVKAMSGTPTFSEIQQGLMDANINLWMIALERPILGTFTNMDLQGNMDKKYAISYRFSEKPERPREVDAWPKTRDEILSRLQDAGDTVSNGRSRCSNCSEIGHTSKFCTQEKAERTDAPKISCYNCNEGGHRIRDCMLWPRAFRPVIANIDAGPKPRVDKFACKNCG
jgi:hypothetical protein